MATALSSSSSPSPEVAIEKITAPYGSWKSPITADVVAGAEKRLGGTAVDEHGRLFWLESRPIESGNLCVDELFWLRLRRSLAMNLDNLVGNEEDYFQRSPINFVDKFSCPILLLQGLEDKVVPPEQARKIYQALKDKGLPVALVEFEGEQHGFRKAETIKFSLEQQMVFFARVVGHFNVADDITPIKIDNFDS